MQATLSTVRTWSRSTLGRRVTPPSPAWSGTSNGCTRLVLALEIVATGESFAISVATTGFMLTLKHDGVICHGEALQQSAERALGGSRMAPERRQGSGGDSFSDAKDFQDNRRSGSVALDDNPALFDLGIRRGTIAKVD
jgi:hypothetical protein